MRRFVVLTLAVTLTALAAGVSAPDADAYRVTPNPVVTEPGWGPMHVALRTGQTAREAAGTATAVQTSALARARTALGALPKVSAAFTTLTVGTAGVSVAWKIGRTIEGATGDTLYWLITGSAAGTDAFSSAGCGTNCLYRAKLASWDYDATQQQWFARVTVQFSSNNGTSWGNTLSASRYWPAANDAMHAAVTGVATSIVTVGSEENGVNGCSNNPCGQLLMSNAAMAGVSTARPVPWTGQAVAATTNITVPTVAYNAAPALAAQAELLVDEADAIAAAGTPAEEDTAAWEAGHTADSEWEGYSGAMVTVPDCAGLTVAGCGALLDGIGHVGARSTVELDIASADVTRPAGAVVTTSPGAGVSFGTAEAIDLNVNPDPMPLELPAPNPAETYAAYLLRLQALGYVGTVTVSTLTEAAGTPELGPDAPVTVKLPAVGTIPARTLSLPGGWPSSSPRIELDTPIEFWKNPSSYAPVPAESVPPATGGGIPPTPALDFTPITDLDWGCKFPFGFICYAQDVTAWFNVSPDAPVFSFDLPSVTLGGTTYDAAAEYVVDLSVMDDYMSLLRDLMSVALWIGTVYLLATRLLGFRAGGDPGEAVDEGLDWQ